jgi:phage terminase small subunit
MVKRSEIPEALQGPPRDKKMSTWKKTKERLMTPVQKPANRPLSQQEWKFVQELVSSFGEITLKEAAIRAGYDPAKAKNRASELTDPRESPHIVAAIQEMRQEMAEVYGTTYERHMRDLQRIRDAAMQAGNYGAAVQAEFRRGQALGTIYVDRKEIKFGQIDSMSKDEVMKELARLKEVYGTPGSIIELKPEQVEQSIERENKAHGETRNLDVPAAAGELARELPANPD